MTRTINGTLRAQLCKGYGLEDLKGDEADVFKRLSFFTADMSDYGYSTVGTATIVITLADDDQIVSDKVESLRAEAKKVQAEATAAVTHIERQINELLALTNEVSA